MDAHHIVHGYGKHAEGIVVPQILFGGEGQALQVFQTLDVAGTHPHFIKFLPVERHRSVNPLGGGLQSAQLNSFERLSGQGFEFDIVDHAG